MNDEIKVAYVVKSIHDPQRRKYDERTIEVPAHVAEEQLSLPEEKRNYHWRGVRFATVEEESEFKGIESKEEKKKPGRPKSIE